jgi:hypothetical protein
LIYNHPNERIYFSPHGRDHSAGFIDYCESCGVTILRSKISIEVDYVDNGLNPRFIYGLTSTALFTLNKIFPTSKIIDVRPVGFIIGNEKLDISLLRDGIETIFI